MASKLAATSQTRTVGANSCANCHAPHNTPGAGKHLLRTTREEQTCFTCHNGGVSTKNLAAEFNKISAHPVLQSSHLHQSGEDSMTAPRHVACADCHNSHATTTADRPGPHIAGALNRVQGVSRSGAPLQNATREYELCFRCHSDNVSGGAATISRHIPETNTRLEFNPLNKSFHPVTAVGKNPNVPSLLPPYTTGSQIQCTDCHNNDQGPGAGGTGPAGPHGSAFAPLLERQLITTDRTPESAAAYALCYKCHSRSSLLADQSFRFHRKHIVDERTACSTCHDAHGVASNPHLINFNRDYVSPASNGKLEFRANTVGPMSGTCTLSCHGVDHQDWSYSPSSIPGEMKMRAASPARARR
jgi:predicted CXXCH cytochrome family protein